MNKTLFKSSVIKINVTKRNNRYEHFKKTDDELITKISEIKRF